MEANNTNANNGKKNIINSTVVSRLRSHRTENHHLHRGKRYPLRSRSQQPSYQQSDRRGYTPVLTYHSRKVGKEYQPLIIRRYQKGASSLKSKGYLKPNEWKNAEGESRHRIVLAARSVKPIAKPASMMEPQPEAIAS